MDLFAKYDDLTLTLTLTLALSLALTLTLILTRYDDDNSGTIDKLEVELLSPTYLQLSPTHLQP